MRRRLFEFLSVVSLALCVATVALRARTASRCDTFGWAGWRDRDAAVWHGFGISSRGGSLAGYYFVTTAGRFDDPTGINGGVPDMQPHAFHHVFGDRSGPPRFRPDRVSVPWMTLYLAGVPHAVWVAAFATCPAAAGLRWAGRRTRRARSRRWEASGLCPGCGYDVRQSPERCPECGTVAAKVAREGSSRDRPP